MNQINDRFAFVQHYPAASLLDNNQFSRYNKNFPSQILNDTVNAYPILEKERLKTELEIIYKREMNGSLNLLLFITENNFQTTFP